MQEFLFCSFSHSQAFSAVFAKAMEGTKRVPATPATKAVRDMVPGVAGLEVASRPVLPENAAVVAKSVARSVIVAVFIFVVFLLSRFRNEYCGERVTQYKCTT
jgi:hypothetical protein